MRTVVTFVAGTLTLAAVVILGWQALAQNKSPAASTPNTTTAPSAIPAPAVAADADRLLKEMGDYIGSAEHLTFQADVAFDHVLPTGQKLQFIATQDVALQRTNGVYIEWSSDLGGRQFWYNGKTITLYDPQTAFYGSDTAPPNIDLMLDKLITQLGFTPPLADFLYSDPYKNLRGNIQYGFTTADAEINGRTCRGLAFVEKHIDWQIWVDTGPQLVPCKLVITYKNNPSLPQFSAVFINWDFNPRIAASTFTPDLPADAQAIPFMTATANASPK
jgi:hypothetical protein